MKYSVALPYPEPGRWTDPELLVEIARSVENCGLDACWLTDHPFPLLDGEAGHQALDPFVAATFLSAATSSLLLHLNVLVMAYRNPFLTARAIASLDRLLPGRLLVGLGAGYMKAEFDALSADFDHRGELLDEGVRAMKGAWSGEPVEMTGQGWQARGNTMHPTPDTRPHPPLWRGGNSARAIRSAVAHFDGWSPFETVGAHAQTTTTAALGGLDGISRGVARLQAEVDQQERGEPIEVCFVRPAPSWFEQSDAKVVEELAELDELGVDWLAVRLPWPSQDELLAQVHRFAELSRTAVLEP